MRRTLHWLVYADAPKVANEETRLRAAARFGCVPLAGLFLSAKNGHGGASLGGYSMTICEKWTIERDECAESSMEEIFSLRFLADLFFRCG